MIGGTTGYDYSCDVHRLHLSSGKWEVHHLNRGIPPDPPGRYRHELGLQLHRSKVFVFGGGTAHFSYGFQVIHFIASNRIKIICWCFFLAHRFWFCLWHLANQKYKMLNIRTIHFECY